MEKLHDLLPDTFGEADITAPLTILRHQGVLLSRRTKGLVEGYVRYIRPEPGFVIELRSQEAQALYNSWRQPLYLQFELNVPTLGDYSYTLFAVTHDVYMYPLIVHFLLIKEYHICHTQEEFEHYVKIIFNHAETRKVIQQLLAQAKA